ncbi:B-type cyclin [Seminavis robusta]|uniref:B-type cyclin n=1 Tax=Seminavis robusta TaxID=568900 RepID=A0A9N8HBB8_9STRA|nr:B-type cyclin [Seminavis robusta]|eukprot:Sro331_g119100.1 B-type cyclin (450) ;mRNA; r:27125-28572
MFSKYGNNYYGNLGTTQVASTTTNSLTNATGNNGRRAFRDVTNAKANMNAKARQGLHGGLNKTQKPQQAPRIQIAVDPQTSLHSFSNLSSKPTQPSAQPINNDAKANGSVPSQSVFGWSSKASVQPFQAVEIQEAPKEQQRNPLLPIEAPKVSSSDTVLEITHAAANNSRVNKNSYQFTGKTDDIDARVAEDPLFVTDYVQGMFAHFREKEKTTAVLPMYMEENQPHINEKMRSILVDWLVEVHMKFKLSPETLYLTINLIDRYLERREVVRSNLQLLGVTCLMIASKYEEIWPPAVQELVYICDNAYTRPQIIKMETQVLRVLQYQITQPSAQTFLVRYLKAAHADKEMTQLACYLLDGTLLSYSLLQYLPSELAAAAVFVARVACNRHPWSPTLLKYSQYLEEEVKPVAQALLEEKSGLSLDLLSVNKKYSSSRYGNVANKPLRVDF